MCLPAPLTHQLASAPSMRFASSAPQANTTSSNCSGRAACTPLVIRGTAALVAPAVVAAAPTAHSFLRLPSHHEVRTNLCSLAGFIHDCHAGRAALHARHAHACSRVPNKTERQPVDAHHQTSLPQPLLQLLVTSLSVQLPTLRVAPPVRTVAGMRSAMVPKMVDSLGKANMVGTSSSSRLGEYWNSLQQTEAQRQPQGVIRYSGHRDMFAGSGARLPAHATSLQPRACCRT